MLDLSVIAAFSGAALLLSLTPGPDMLYVLSRGAAQGRRAGLAAALGLGLGLTVHTLFAVVGLAALLHASAVAFTIVRLLGAAYLVYLGIRMIRDASAFRLQRETGKQQLLQVFRQSALTNVLNPKVAMFFVAFLPQFVDPSRGDATWQLAELGGVMILLTLIVKGAIGWSAGTLRDWLVNHERSRRRLQCGAGGLVVALGVGLALPQRG